MKKSLSALGALMLALSTHAAEWFVDASRPDDTGDGAIWATAKKTIQAAIDLAGVSEGDTIWVTNGVYDTGGAYASGETVLSRVYINKAVILRAGNMNPSATVIEGRWHDPGVTRHGADAVRCVHMTTAGAELHGFTLTNGATQSVDPSGQRRGGGLFGGADIIVSNCVFTDNAAAQLGGGTYASGSKFYDCRFYGNTAGNGAGANVTGATEFHDSVFSNNYAGSQFGGAYSSHPYVIFSNCVFVANFAYYDGGGCGAGGGTGVRGTHYSSVIYNNTAGRSGGGTAGGVFYDCRIYGNALNGGWNYDGGGAYGGTFYNCAIYGNTGNRYGGGAYNAALYDCEVQGNTVPNTGFTYGGGAYGCALYRCRVYDNLGRYGGGTALSTNYACVVFNNNGSYGGGIYSGIAYNSLIAANQNYGAYSMTLYNCAVVGNVAGAYGGTIYNSILYYNNNNHANSPAFYNSCTFPEVPGWAEGNITNAPLFVDPGSAASGYGTNYVIGNCRLTKESPCLNNGLYYDWMAPGDPHGRDMDLDGGPRIRHHIVDMGAYETRLKRGTIFTAE